MLFDWEDSQILTVSQFSGVFGCVFLVHVTNLLLSFELIGYFLHHSLQ